MSKQAHTVCIHNRLSRELHTIANAMATNEYDVQNSCIEFHFSRASAVAGIAWPVADPSRINAQYGLLLAFAVRLV